MRVHLLHLPSNHSHHIHLLLYCLPWALHQKLACPPSALAPLSIFFVRVLPVEVVLTWILASVWRFCFLLPPAKLCSRRMLTRRGCEVMLLEKENISISQNGPIGHPGSFSEAALSTETQAICLSSLFSERCNKTPPQHRIQYDYKKCMLIWRTGHEF